MEVRGPFDGSIAEEEKRGAKVRDRKEGRKTWELPSRTLLRVNGRTAKVCFRSCAPSAGPNHAMSRKGRGVRSGASRSAPRRR